MRLLGNLAGKIREAAKSLMRFRKKILPDMYKYRGFTRQEYLAYKLIPVIDILMDTHNDEWRGTPAKLFKAFMDNSAALTPQFAESLTSPKALLSRLDATIPVFDAVAIDVRIRPSAKGKGTIITIKQHTVDI
jgi:hypothetical protein